MKNKKGINSYQKMKAKYEKRIQELTNDIEIMVMSDNHMEKLTVLAKWQLTFQMDRLMWKGETQINN